MGCGSSTSVNTNSESSIKEGETATDSDVKHGVVKVCPQAIDHELEKVEEQRGNDEVESRPKTRNAAIAFEVIIGEDRGIRKPPPQRLSRLDPIDGPRLTAEDLEEKLRLAERKRNSELESRAKTASESRRQSKRKRELMVAQELERQHQQARKLESKLKSAERQREVQQQQKSERQKIQEERLRRAQQRKEKLLLDDDVISDVERDENFNNDDVDSWLEGSNNETNTVDTGFSSATSERIYSGKESPKKRHNPNMVLYDSYINQSDNDKLQQNKNLDRELVSESPAEEQWREWE